ncbi:anti-sigma factor family protein [Sinorhizobium terangae]|uniref:Anti-sigma factor n=1 Tax=Sinorhizobium terangae TaxID=110322 RepID=A0A6N7L6Z7_SINTE|nr:anti-sigma factor [Sinorhizobium terangae]MBB4185591.1 anti-sigma factor RsiW [Sinorhizobium terangae]MQX13346.1 anti-sigma factor [Sinorhizobium terangae]WFU46345.1 anti-sigma factor [Sinorhizobium terangae]
MTDDFNTVSEDELHAYVDGQLSQPERERIEAWLERHPARAEEVRQWQAQAAALKSHFASYARSDDSDRVLVATRRAAPKVGAISSGIVRRAAAGLLIFAAGALTGLYTPAIVAPDRPLQIAEERETLPRQAQSAFLIYASEVRHPVEVGADEQGHLANWLGKRLDYALRIPDLSTLGFSLVGGRLVPVNGKAGAMLMYEDGTGQRLTVLLGRDTENRETSFRIASQSGVETFYWIDSGIGYAVTGEVSRDLLQKVAHECYRQFEGSSES